MAGERAGYITVVGRNKKFLLRYEGARLWEYLNKEWKRLLETPIEEW